MIKNELKIVYIADKGEFDQAAESVFTSLDISYLVYIL